MIRQLLQRKLYVILFKLSTKFTYGITLKRQNEDKAFNVGMDLFILVHKSLQYEHNFMELIKGF